MAGDGELKFGTKIDTKGFEEGVDSLKKKGKQATESFDEGIETNKTSLISFRNIAKTVGAYIGADLFKDAISTGVQFNAQVEQYTTTFETFTGSVEKANDVVNQLVDLGSSTPFEFLDLANATQKLMSFGFSADEALGSLTMLGDASQGDAQKLESIVTAFGRMSSSAKVTLEDLNMMIDVGFNPLTTVAENAGMTMAEVYDAISDGKISVEQVTEAMQQMTSEGGQYFGLMEKQSQTLNGQLSTLSDNVQNKLGQAFQGVNDILKNDLVPTLNSFLSGEIDFGTFTSQIVGIGSDIVTSLGNSIASSAPDLINKGIDLAVNLSEGIIDGLPNLTSGLLDLLQSIGDWLTEQAPTWIEKGFEILSNLVQGIIDSIPIMIEQLPQVISTFANIINDNFPTILAKGAELLWQLITGILSAIPTLIANIPKIVSAIWDTLMAVQWLNLGSQIITFLGDGIKGMGSFIIEKAQGIVGNIINKIGELPGNLLSLGRSAIQSLGGGITGLGSWLKTQAGNIVTWVVDAVTSLPSKMVEIGKNLIKGLWNGIKNVKDWILDKIKGFGQSVLDSIKGFFGIKSPSRVMAKLVGKFLPMGIAVGFEDELPNSVKDMEKSLDLVNKGISLKTSELGSYLGNNFGRNYYTGDTVTTNNNKQTINFYQKAESPAEFSRRLRLDTQRGLIG